MSEYTVRITGEGYPTNPILDRRVPMIGAAVADDDARDGHPPTNLDPAARARVLALYRERNTCDDVRVEEIDAEILDTLREYVVDDNHPALG